MLSNFIMFLFAFMAAPQGDDAAKRLLQVVPSVDVKRYCGLWYEIARLPNSFQKKCARDVTATYTLLDDGDITVVNRCRKENGEFMEAAGKARRMSTDEPNSKLEVRFAPAFLSFLPFVWGDYWIVDLASDYSYAVVGEPARKYLWILARSPKMSQETYDGIILRIKEQGYDPSGLVKTEHSD
jgi:apolipoprotein D and lipocalin family protein